MSTRIQKAKAEKEKQIKAAQERKQKDFISEETVKLRIKSHNVIIEVRKSKYDHLGKEKCISNWIENFEARTQ